ncbi:TspO and MBR related proteins [Fervidobacterium changbaicum]|uniref:Tryptophan-rich sensory protein n=1 Tax=Fervidobacterium changbaicum TaxID=310769 RepID=A0ABX5QU20_9BACT|nr:TspO/MBR family protein [Fervidobacterium changbaicum]QAV34042.1 tryptophan-rich sensory protein [Fervidobacterium changbaicum]SDH38240.1 TspO and MBR related proteins [Fervidobacterium changbaicum]
MSRRTKALISGLLLVLTLVVNALGAFGFINGRSQKDISDSYPTLITPAPSTFSIWSLIYILLISSVIVMIVRANDEYYGNIIDEIAPLFWLSCIFNIIWIVLFSFDLIGLSTLAIFGLLIVDILIVQRIGKLQTQRRFLFPVTFGLYSGWLFIATVANITLWLVSINWNGFGINPEIWGVVILLVAVVLTWLVLTRIKNAIFPLPIAWAYFGIYKNLTSPEGFNNQYTLLPKIAIIGGILLIAIAVFQLYRNKFCSMPIRNE